MKIWVEHRSLAIEETKKEPEVSANLFSSQFKVLLESGSHSDIIFLVGEEETKVPAHKAILTARYVRVEFRFDMTSAPFIIFIFHVYFFFIISLVAFFYVV